MSSNEGRKWGSGHQQAVKTEISLQTIQILVSIAQIPHGLGVDLTQVPAVPAQWLTASAMAQPSIILKCT
jgi:hypothetical protein